MFVLNYYLLPVHQNVVLFVTAIFFCMQQFRILNISNILNFIFCIKQLNNYLKYTYDQPYFFLVGTYLIFSHE